MAVYVDNMFLPYGRMKMCHMVADTPEELRNILGQLGVQPKWIQYPGTYREHYDICKAKREQAIKLGAKEITWREYAFFIGDKRRKELCGQVHDDSGRGSVPPLSGEPTATFASGLDGETEGGGRQHMLQL